jgi:archaellum biogenesis ATPase FlaH
MPLITMMDSKRLFSLLAVFIFANAPVCRSAPDDTALLNTLGYTTGQSILLTHMAIGTLADAYVGKAYKAEQTTTILATYVNVTSGLKTQMNKLLAAGTLSTSDSEFMKRTITVLDSVLEEANAFKTYIATKNNDNAQRYDKARQKALTEVKSLLGIKD